MARAAGAAAEGPERPQVCDVQCPASLPHGAPEIPARSLGLIFVVSRVLLTVLRPSGGPRAPEAARSL
eukprot:4514599-Pyramimonas_sp.AAC.1